MAFRLAPRGFGLAHRAIGVLTPSMAFRSTSVQLDLAHSTEHCRRSHAVDGIQIHFRAAGACLRHC
jgi:hypothetical protein